MVYVRGAHHKGETFHNEMALYNQACKYADNNVAELNNGQAPDVTKYKLFDWDRHTRGTARITGIPLKSMFGRFLVSKRLGILRNREIVELVSNKYSDKASNLVWCEAFNHCLKTQTGVSYEVHCD